MNNLEYLKNIRRDCEADAAMSEGMPLTGRNVGEMFGKTLALIDALAAFLIKKETELKEFNSVSVFQMSGDKIVK